MISAKNINRIAVGLIASVLVLTDMPRVMILLKQPTNIIFTVLGIVAVIVALTFFAIDCVKARLSIAPIDWFIKFVGIVVFATACISIAVDLYIPQERLREMQVE